MGNLLAPGGSGGGVSAGALTTMWRSVYRKAADAAEARLQALLGAHVQQGHGRRALCVVLDGGGAALTAGQKCDLELPWAYVLEGWALYADVAGALQVDLLKSAGYATYPADLATICGGVPPALSGVQKARADDLAAAGWTTALPRGAVLRASVVGASGPRLATLTLFVRAV